VPADGHGIRDDRNPNRFETNMVAALGAQAGFSADPVGLASRDILFWRLSAADGDAGTHLLSVASYRVRPRMGAVGLAWLRMCTWL